jgi:hypothetical protein
MQKDNDSIGFDAPRAYRRKKAGRGITSFSSMKSFSRATGQQAETKEVEA